MLGYKDDYTAPYDDAKMTYHYTEHKYTLDMDNQQFETGINLSQIWQGNDNALMYLEMVREVAYTYVLGMKDSKWHLRMLYYLSHSKEMRRAMYELMIDTVRYNHEDGGFMIAYQTGINLHEMKELRMRIENAVSIVGERIARNFGLAQRFLNVNLNTMTTFDDFDTLLAYIVGLGYLTEEESEDFEDLDDLPYDYRYQAFLNPRGEYMFEDTQTFQTAMTVYGSDW
jgi:hypothetical protein